MENRVLPAAGQFFMDKEKNLVQFIAIATYKRMEGEIAVYQALSGDYKVYAIPLADFIKEMNPFMPQNETAPLRGISPRIMENDDIVQDIKKEEKVYTRELSGSRSDDHILEETQAGTVNPVLLSFLEAETYEDKLNILTGGRKYLDDRILNQMAISVDCILGEGDIEEKISNLVYCLKTHIRFENKRLR